MGHDNSDKFVSLRKTNDNIMVISGTMNDYITIGNVNETPVPNKTLFYNQSKANINVLNQWICLSLHWNVVSGISS